MRKFLSNTIALLGFFAVVTQFILMVWASEGSMVQNLLMFFSYFTILTNTLVTFCYWRESLSNKPNSKCFFDRSGLLTAITIYITMVGLVYQVTLRGVWEPQGLQMVVDELLHSIIPILVVIYWARYEKKDKIRWSQLPLMLIYPLLYLIYILVSGEFSDFYPYYFIDVNKLGWAKVLQHTIMLILTFVVLALGFIGMGKLMAKKSLYFKREA
ncbi:Pr6Pr family membrane protein [Echinicola sp. CAU 1574]|uniref:Pr6Pr family membrane protein n=1 Tax=Echinicola arenosa TaxID=2774144 RepID=A0ABR9AMT1_9BACT|nr:Pr6Pr family membrane protein [Echinicola arenosa]MBD8489647.1 Pr6Pr family membrane protein [Echinicola arenosa]